MKKDSDKKTQEEALEEQYEFGLNEETRKEMEKDDDDHKESDNVADQDDIVMKDK